MKTQLELEILPQPDSTTCGPTCLHAVYRYYGEDITLKEIVSEVPMLEEGGTLAVMLGVHALQRGFSATIYTYNLEVFDPTWFTRPGVDLAERLSAQARIKKNNRKLNLATKTYLEYLRLGGRILFDDLRPSLIRRILVQGSPILTGLSSTFLYREPRELPTTEPDDLGGKPQGHFVVLYGYDKETRKVSIADPFTPNAVSSHQHYTMEIERIIGAIFLGVLTYDANLLILKPGRGAGKSNG